MCYSVLLLIQFQLKAQAQQQSSSSNPCHQIPTKSWLTINGELNGNSLHLRSLWMIGIMMSFFEVYEPLQKLKAWQMFVIINTNLREVILTGTNSLMSKKLCLFYASQNNPNRFAKALVWQHNMDQDALLKPKSDKDRQTDCRTEI